MNSTAKFDPALLGGLGPGRFLKTHWQKKPLLIRAAVPAFTGTVSPDQLFEMAASDDVESRLVSRSGDRWTVAAGPIAATPRKKSNWTLLIQGVNLHDEATDALMRRFNFISDTRLDDVMVSFAADGGGVGPHFDDYDVFLLQGQGERRWRFGAQRDLELLEGAPLKILSDFRPDEEFVLRPGDMLYLPPRIAHEGVAVGPCTTYSIGFRAPGFQEIVREFFTDQADRIEISGRYADPARRPSAYPARIDKDLVYAALREIEAFRWSEGDVGDFLGRYLSEPKPQVFFEQNHESSLARFKKRAAAMGVKLDLETRMLYRGQKFFINGELVPGVRGRGWLRRLADSRALNAEEFAEIGGDLDLLALLFDWYAAGWLTANV